MKSNELFRCGGCIVRLLGEKDLRATLEVYRQSEDFLSLGPVAKASMNMVKADVEHSRHAGGLYCVVEDGNGNQIGVLDFIPGKPEEPAVLSLLMISRAHRNRGHGTAIVTGLESWLKREYRTRTIESGVQANNEAAMRFWKDRGFQIDSKETLQQDGTVTHSMTRTV